MTTLSVTIDELKRAGLPYTAERGAKHIKIKAEGLPLIVCSYSCSDHRGEQAARALVRRLLKQNGPGVTK